MRWVGSWLFESFEIKLGNRLKPVVLVQFAVKISTPISISLGLHVLSSTIKELKSILTYASVQLTYRILM